MKTEFLDAEQRLHARLVGVGVCGAVNPQPFAGWLELLGILTGLLPSGDGSSGAAQRLRGQLHPGGQTELGEDV